MGTERWQYAIVDRGKPRVYIQQYLDLKLPEEEYQQIAAALGFQEAFEEDAAAAVMDRYLEDLADGSQFDSVHMHRADGFVVLMTVVSFPFKQDTFDRLLAAHVAKKSLGSAQ